MKKKCCFLTGRSGFTVIELVVTMAIFATLALITIPSYMSWMPSYQLKGAARDIYSNLQLAKLEAIKRNSVTGSAVTIDTGANTYNMALLAKTVSLGDYGSGVTFTDTGNMDTTITFDSRGMATISPDTDGDKVGKIFVTNSKKSAIYTIQITRVGSITLTQ
jgi:prepilin-type N-terminal cleavage/methylation domain-containing protein